MPVFLCFLFPVKHRSDFGLLRALADVQFNCTSVDSYSLFLRYAKTAALQ